MGGLFVVGPQPQDRFCTLFVEPRSFWHKCSFLGICVNSYLDIASSIVHDARGPMDGGGVFCRTVRGLQERFFLCGRNGPHLRAPRGLRHRLGGNRVKRLREALGVSLCGLAVRTATTGPIRCISWCGA